MIPRLWLSSWFTTFTDCHRGPSRQCSTGHISAHLKVGPDLHERRSWQATVLRHDLAHSGEDVHAVNAHRSLRRNQNQCHFWYALKITFWRNAFGYMLFFLLYSVEMCNGLSLYQSLHFVWREYYLTVY